MISRILLDISPLKRFPEFRKLWLGYLVRQFGAQVTVTTVIYQVFAITHSNLAVGLISLAQFVPGVISPIFGGAIADAVDRRKLLMVTAILIAISTTGLAVNSIGSHPALWVLYVCSGATWALQGVDEPTRSAALITLVDRDSYLAANVVKQFVSQTGKVLGPAMAGVLIAVFSRNLDIVYWIDVASTLSALQFVIRLAPLPQIAKQKFGFESLAGGVRFLMEKKVILAGFITDIDAEFLSLRTSLFPYMATVHFHGGAKTFGLMAAAPGVGAMIGGAFSGWTTRINYQGRAAMIAVAIWGLAVAGFGLAPWLALGLFLLAMTGWANSLSGFMRQTIIQTETPDHLRGRITGLNTISSETAKLGNFEAGLVASISSAQTSIVTGGLGTVLGVFLISRLIPSYRRYRLFKDRDEDEIASANERDIKSM